MTVKNLSKKKQFILTTWRHTQKKKTEKKAIIKGQDLSARSPPKTSAPILRGTREKQMPYLAGNCWHSCGRIKCRGSDLKESASHHTVHTHVRIQIYSLKGLLLFRLVFIFRAESSDSFGAVVASPSAVTPSGAVFWVHPSTVRLCLSHFTIGARTHTHTQTRTHSERLGSSGS